MNQIQLLTTIDGIKAEGDYDKSDQIADYHFLSNDPDFVTGLIAEGTDSFRREFGELNFKTVKESKATVFLQIPFKDSQALKIFLSKRLNSLIMGFRLRASWFTQFLWMVKDSSASVGNIYFILNKRATGISIPPCFSSNCKGELAPVTFQRDEIKSAISMLERYRSSQRKGGKASASDDLSSSGGFRSAFISSTSRLSKALLMLQVVRQSEDMALKIAHYCSCFEILFSSASDTEGITHKLAERIAVFLYASVKERVAVYEDVRAAYRVRCEVFHGKFLKEKRISQLERLCVSCDGLLREILRRILASTEHAALFTDEGDKFDEYFRDCIFGAYET